MCAHTHPMRNGSRAPRAGSGGKGSSDAGRTRGAELALAFIGLLWLTHGLDFILYEAFPKVVVRVFALGLYVASVGVLLRKWRGHESALIRSWPIWVAPLLALLSILWSAQPDLTLLRASALLGATCFAVFLAVRFDLEEQIRMVAACIVLVAVASLVLALFFPQLGLMGGSHYLRGVFGHKNYLSRAMGLGSLALVLLALGTDGSRRWWYSIGAAACVVIGVATQAASGIITIGTTLAAVAALRTVQLQPASKRPRALVAIAVMAAVGIGIATLFADDVLAPLGKDSTLSGRIYIWRASWRAALGEPWLGYGYGAVWYTHRPGVHQLITRDIGFDPLTAHSGFFDLFLELGVFGLLAFALPLVLCAYRAVDWILRRNLPLFIWPAAYLVFFVVSNVAESKMVRHNTIFWVLFAAAVVNVRSGKETAPP